MDNRWVSNYLSSFLCFHIKGIPMELPGRLLLLQKFLHGILLLFAVLHFYLTAITLLLQAFHQLSGKIRNQLEGQLIRQVKICLNRLPMQLYKYIRGAKML